MIPGKHFDRNAGSWAANSVGYNFRILLLTGADISFAAPDAGRFFTVSAKKSSQTERLTNLIRMKPNRRVPRLISGSKACIARPVKY